MCGGGGKNLESPLEKKEEEKEKLLLIFPHLCNPQKNTWQLGIHTTHTPHTGILNSPLCKSLLNSKVFFSLFRHFPTTAP